MGELDGQVYIAVGGGCTTGDGAEDGQKGEVVLLGKVDEFGRGFGREGAGAVEAVWQLHWLGGHGLPTYRLDLVGHKIAIHWLRVVLHQTHQPQFAELY